MFTLSGFGDEISESLKEQLSVLESEGIRNIELRAVNGKGILDLNKDELKEVRIELHSANISVSAVASPIGKINITDDFPSHLEKFEKALDVARFFETPYVRVFSYYIPDGEYKEYRDEVLMRMNRKVKLARKAKIILLHENEHGIYGDIPERCLDILTTIGSENLMATFDPANFIIEGVKPFTDAYPAVGRYIEYMHIKDATFKNDEVVPAGEGDGEIREILTALSNRGYEGFLSIEPHLPGAGSGMEKFKKAAMALKKVLKETGCKY